MLPIPPASELQSAIELSALVRGRAANPGPERLSFESGLNLVERPGEGLADRADAGKPDRHGDDREAGEFHGAALQPAVRGGFRKGAGLEPPFGKVSACRRRRGVVAADEGR